MQLPLEPGDRAAVLSEDGRYRYALSRRWSSGPVLGWVMLNPSTADAQEDDPTIRRCIAFSRAWGYGALIVVNVYALRSTDPSALQVAGVDRLGEWPRLRVARHLADEGVELAICAWGKHAAFYDADEMQRCLRVAGVATQCLVRNRDGSPRHPLYVASSTHPIPYP